MCIETTACLDASTRVFPAHFVWCHERWALGGAWCFGCGKMDPFDFPCGETNKDGDIYFEQTSAGIILVTIF